MKKEKAKFKKKSKKNQYSQKKKKFYDSPSQLFYLKIK